MTAERKEIREKMVDYLASGDYDSEVCLRASMICRGKTETSMARTFEKWAREFRMGAAEKPEDTREDNL